MRKNLEFTVLEGNKLLIRSGENSWFYWLEKERWIDSKEYSNPDQIYYGSLQDFLAQNIDKPKDFPKNHRKAWSKSEVRSLNFFGAENKLTAAAIAERLERSVYSVIIKYAAERRIQNLNLSLIGIEQQKTILDIIFNA